MSAMSSTSASMLVTKECVSKLDTETALSQFCKEKNIPHLLFVGRRGTGKSRAIRDCLLSLYGEEACRDSHVLSMYVKYVNCAFEKGIQYIRDHLKQFAKMQVLPCNSVCFKCIVLLNADCLTMDAQSALRRCIEEHSRTTRFLFHAETKEPIMQPILSRLCAISFEGRSQYALQLRARFPEQYRLQKVREMGAWATLGLHSFVGESGGAGKSAFDVAWVSARRQEGWTAQAWLNGIRREMETQRYMYTSSWNAEKEAEWSAVVAECETVIADTKHDAIALLFMSRRIVRWLRANGWFS